MSDEVTLLVARQMAALRKRGLSTLEALRVVAEPLPPGPVRELCLRVLTSLRAGQAQAPQGAGVLERALSAGDATDATGFVCVARALEAGQQAERASRSTQRVLRVVLAGPLVVGSVLGWTMGARYESLGDSFGPLPALTQVGLSMLWGLQWLGVPLAAGAVLLAPWLARRFSPGRVAFERARRLFEVSVRGDEQALPELPAGDAQRFYAWRRSVVGPALAAHDLADAELREAVAKSETFARLVPVLAAVFALLFGSTTLGLLYLPIFSIAATIK